MRSRFRWTFSTAGLAAVVLTAGLLGAAPPSNNSVAEVPGSGASSVHDGTGSAAAGARGPDHSWFQDDASSSYATSGAGAATPSAGQAAAGTSPRSAQHGPATTAAGGSWTADADGDVAPTSAGTMRSGATRSSRPRPTGPKSSTAKVTGSTTTSSKATKSAASKKSKKKPSSSGSTSPKPSTDTRSTPRLIKHGWDVPRPAYVRANVTAMERMPYDGTTIALPGSLGEKIQSQTPVSLKELRKALSPVAETKFTKLRHNFVMVYSAPAGDLYDSWSVPLQNFANLAQAAREAGFTGVFYDIEEYFGASLRYPRNCQGRSVADCQAQAQLRGRQVMDAMRSKWPDVEVISSFGAWISAPETARNLPGVRYNDIAWANQLSGPFVVGMVDSAAGTPAQLIDGGEIYTARTKEQFRTIRSWQKHGMPKHSSLVPSRLRGVWPTEVSAAFAVYDRPWIGVSMNASTWRTTLANALATTDKYVWAYTERHDWWGSGWPTDPVPRAWVDATRAALRDVGR